MKEKTIDVNESRKASENALEEYRFMLLTQSLDMIPKVTSSFSIVPPSNTNRFYSTTEDAAIKNVDYETNRSDYIKRIAIAVNRLNELERSILIMRYMLEDDVFDYQVYNDLNLSESKYHRVKARALYKLALILGVEIYKDGVKQ